MRKILCIALAVLLISGTAFALVPGWRQGPGATGEIKSSGATLDNCPRTFRMVRYCQTLKVNAGLDDSDWNSSHLTPDTLVIWHTVSEDDGVTITVTNVTCDSRVAGIAVTNFLTQDTQGNTAAQDLGKNNWGYIQTFGPCEVTIEAGSTASAGDAFGTADGSIGGVELFTVGATGSPQAANLSANYGNAGFFMDAATSGEQDVVAFIRTE